MREEKLINRGWQFALLPCTPIDAKTAKKKELQRKQSGEDVRTELENLQFAEVDLPHDWAVSRPFNKVMEDGMSQGFRDRWGIGWYKKTLNIEEKKKGKRYLLYFGGVYENAVLWVNGMKIGSHKYGYSSFKMDITDYLDVIAIWYRDVLIYKATKNVDRVVFSDQMRYIKERASKSSYEGIENILDGLEKAKARLKANVNFELTMELLLLTIKEN